MKPKEKTKQYSCVTWNGLKCLFKCHFLVWRDVSGICLGEIYLSVSQIVPLYHFDCFVAVILGKRISSLTILVKVSKTRMDAEVQHFHANNRSEQIKGSLMAPCHKTTADSTCCRICARFKILMT